MPYDAGGGFPIVTGQAREAGRMKITAIRNLFMAVERQNWHFVEVETDAGIIGVGEASLEGRERTVATAGEGLARFLIGGEAGPIEAHWPRPHRHGLLPRGGGAPPPPPAPAAG